MKSCDKIWGKLEENRDDGQVWLGGDFRVKGRCARWDIWLFLMRQ